LLPVGVNNKQTAPRNAQHYNYSATEIIATINVPSGVVAGQTLYKNKMGPESCARLKHLSRAWQRIDWQSVQFKLVALNGSEVKSGYTMGFIEDPEVEFPTNDSETLAFLTSLRGTTVRQAWVESSAGQTVNTRDLPEMFTTLGSDSRRYYIGGLLIAASGEVTTGATFQLMMKYSVKLYVPKLPTGDPSPATRFILPTSATSNITNDTDPSLTCTTAIPPRGTYKFPNNQVQDIVTYGNEDGDDLLLLAFRGFEVLTPGGAGAAWGADTKLIKLDNTLASWPKQTNSLGTFPIGGYLYLGDATHQRPVPVLQAGQEFIFTPAP
jgi:hypothetical protein